MATLLKKLIEWIKFNFVRSNQDNSNRIEITQKRTKDSPIDIKQNYYHDNKEIPKKSQDY